MPTSIGNKKSLLQIVLAMATFDNITSARFDLPAVPDICITEQRDTFTNQLFNTVDQNKDEELFEYTDISDIDQLKAIFERDNELAGLSTLKYSVRERVDPLGVKGPLLSISSLQFGEMNVYGTAGVAEELFDFKTELGSNPINAFQVISNEIDGVRDIGFSTE